jgi:hypothetical protein
MTRTMMTMTRTMMTMTMTLLMMMMTLLMMTLLMMMMMMTVRDGSGALVVVNRREPKPCLRSQNQE